ncbi:MAG: methyltransferase domain-containing protein [Burkholderiales bacterium]|nr:methyltransferase domain-containing protein [Burkholderiales bacterium]
MLRRLLTQVLSKNPHRPTAAAAAVRIEAGAVVFIVNTDEPARVLPGAEMFSELASLRLRTIPIARALAAARPVYFLPPALLAQESTLDALARADTLVIAKFSTGDLIKQPESFEILLEWLPEVKAGTRLIADFSDNYAGYNEQYRTELLVRYQRTLAQHCTLIVSCEALRRELLPHARHGIHVVEDPFESPQPRPPRLTMRDPVHLCWFGSIGDPNLETTVEGLSRALAGLGERRAQLAFVTHETRRGMAATIGARLAAQHRVVTTFVPWSLAATWQAIDECDLVILPQDHRDPWGRVKSHNRLVETIRGGRLAIASPIPSYLELASYAWIGEDLAQGVDWALSNPQAALERIRAGQIHVSSRFAPERIVNEWQRLLAPRASTAAQAPSVPAPEEPGARLNLGCGDKILPGYVNVDVAPSRAGKPPDVLCDLHRLEPFRTNTAQEILAVHVVEHFWRWEVVDILKEWVRVLKPGGRMILECPNLLTACEEFLRNPAAGSGPGPEGQRTMWVFYGDPAWKDPLMCHRWNYTPQSLGAIMAEAGLVNIRQEAAQYKLREPRDMRMVGEKPSDDR